MSNTSRQFEQDGYTIAWYSSDTGDKPVQIVWAHGWGQDHRAMQALADSGESGASHILLDFPGFGASPRPPADWGTADYADATAALLATLPRRRRIWVGHSFGCRVGLQLAARHPEAVDGMLLLAAAGLPRRRTPLAALRVRLRIGLYKLLRALPLGDKDRLRERFGSADYRAAGAMRGVLTRVVNEDLSEAARAVQCPVRLVYGRNDSETPPEIGERLAGLIPGAECVVVDGLDHYSILGEGRHQVAFQVRRLLDALEPVS